MATKKNEKILTLAQAFGMTVKAYREKSGLTQDKLAFKAEIDRGYMSQIERGVKNVTLPFVWKLAEALEVSPIELLEPLARRFKNLK